MVRNALIVGGGTAARAGVYRFHKEAKQALAEIRRQAEFACRALPSHRDLLKSAQLREFGSAA
jgi:tryptophan 7-halogenase